MHSKQAPPSEKRSHAALENRAREHQPCVVGM